MSTLAFALAATINHDGNGGIADLLATPDEVASWLEQHSDLVEEVLGRPLAFGSGAERNDGVGGGGPLHEHGAHDNVRVRDELVRIRRAVRALFARAVAPGAPSKADAGRLMDGGAALRMVNRAADRLGTVHLEWAEGDVPTTRWAGRTDDPVVLLAGAVGRSTIDFLTGPGSGRLRACPAARCVKYFLQDDPRQMWCSPACGNRERVNRHYRKRQGG